MLFTDDVVAALCSPVAGHCTNDVKSWLEADRWCVLSEMWGKAVCLTPAWEVGWREVARMLEGNSPSLLRPVALSTRCKDKVAKSVVAECEVSGLSPPFPFDIRWSRAVNGRLPLSVALDATATPNCCPARLIDADCGCAGLEVPLQGHPGY